MTLPWHPYDPGEPYPETAFEGDCPLLVLLATPGADPGWSTRAAVSLARQWVARGDRIFLADLGFGHPRLHADLGQPNGEGMSDVFLYGASLRRIARATEEGFFFAPAGTPVADPHPVLTSRRWTLLTQGFSRAGAHLVVYLPAGEAGYESVLDHAGRVLVLAGAGEADAPSVAGAWSDRVIAVLSPPVQGVGGTDAERGSEAAAPAATLEDGRPAGGEPDDAPAVEADAAGDAALPEPEKRPPADAAVATVGHTEGPRVDGATRDEGAGKGVEPSADPEAPLDPSGPSTGRLVLLLVVLVLAVLALLATFGVLPRPGPEGPEASLEGPQDPPAPASAPVPVTDSIGGTSEGSYFLTLGSYSEGAVAALQAEYLAERRPDLLFIVSPVDVNGEVFHRLLAGAAADSIAAELRGSLGRTLTQEDPGAWVVRHAPMSFHIGSFETPVEARARAAELHALEIPAYVLHERSNPGRESFEVWAGAYTDAAEAGHLARALELNGIEPSLVRRTGAPPA